MGKYLITNKQNSKMETNEEKLIRLQKLEDCIRSLYMEIPCEATPEFIEYIKQFVKL
jgi:hypothetical protein